MQVIPEKIPDLKRKTSKVQKQKKVKQYTLVTDEQLGKGQFGMVYRAFLSSDKKKQYACKQIALKNPNSQTESFIKALQREINIQKELESQYIVKLHDVVQTSNNLYIFMELCLEGDLQEVLKKKPKQRLSEVETIQYLKHIVQAFKEMNKKRIIHRDIKPSNIMLAQGKAKITDFGFARKIQEHCSVNDPMAMSTCGTPLYMSPQVLQHEDFSSKCDVWSVGIMIYELLYGRTPWNGSSQVNLLTNIKKIPLTFDSQPQRSEGIKNLIRKMLKIKEQDRYSWDQVINDPIFQNSKKGNNLDNSVCIMQSSSRSCILVQPCIQTQQNAAADFSKRVQGYLKDVEDSQNQQNEIDGTEIAEENAPFQTCQSMMMESPDQRIDSQKQILKVYQYALYQRNVGKFLTLVCQKYFELMNNYSLQINEEEFYKVLLYISLYENNFLNLVNKTLKKNINDNFSGDVWKKYQKTIECYKITSMIENDIEISNRFVEKIFIQAQDKINDNQTKNFLKEQKLLHKNYTAEFNKGREALDSPTTIQKVKEAKRRKSLLFQDTQNNLAPIAAQRRNSVMFNPQNLQALISKSKETQHKNLEQNVTFLKKKLKKIVKLWIKSMYSQIKQNLSYDDELYTFKYMIVFSDYGNYIKKDWNFDFFAFYEEIESEPNVSVLQQMEKYLQQKN